MANTETRVTSVQIPVGTLEQLKTLANEADRTLSAEIRRALNEHLAREAAGGGVTERAHGSGVSPASAGRRGVGEGS